MNNIELKDIKRSIITKYKKKIYARFLRGVKEFNLVEDNDVIGVCISGGKDSFLLAMCMKELQIHSKFNFDIKYIVMDPGYKDEDLDNIKDNLKKLDIDAFIYQSNIFDQIKDQKSLCYLCARKRRGSLYAKAQDLGCNKIALGHTFDDVIETILLNLFYNGEYKAMLPKVKSKNFDNMSLIRPLYYVKEEDISSWGRYSNLEFANKACKVTTKNIGKRQEVKALIKMLKKDNKNIDINILRSSENVCMGSVLGTKNENK